MRKKSLSQTLADNLARLMEDNPAIDTQTKLAAATGWKGPGSESGVSQQHISRILKGELSVGLDIVEAVARGIGVEPWELLVDEDATREAAYLRIMSRPTTPERTSGKVVVMRRRRKA